MTCIINPLLSFPSSFIGNLKSIFVDVTTSFEVVTDIDAVAGTACYPDIGFSDLGIFNLFCFVALKYVRDIIKV